MTHKGRRGLTIKQENFCQAFIELGVASHAYQQAYNAENMKPATVHRRAHDLVTTNDAVMARIAELREQSVKRHLVTVDSLTDELDDMLGLATKNEQPAAGVSAVLGKAKIHGYLTEDRSNERDPIKDMSDKELDARIAELAGEE